MSEFRNKVITPKGMELLTKAMAGEPLTFTSIKLGSGTFEGDIGLVDKMVNIRQELPINKILRKGSQVTLSATLKLEDIKEPFEWSEIGIYAKGTDNIEHLYMYSYTENTSYISKDSLNEKLIHVTVMVSNASEVTAIIDDSLIYLTAQSLQEHNMDAFAHEELREKIILNVEMINGIEIKINDLERQTGSLSESINNQTTELKEHMDANHQAIATSIEQLPKGTVKKVYSYRGKLNKIDTSSSVSMAITAVDPNKSSINLINCSADLVIPYLGGSNVVVFTNMSASSYYSSVVYGFEVIEYY